MTVSKKGNKGIYIVLALVGLVGAWWMWGRKPQDLSIKVALETVKEQALIERVSASGKVFPEVEIEITSNVSGTLVDLYVKEGDYVKAGQLLAKVDADALNSVVERTEAATSTAKAQLEGIRSQKEQLEAQFKNTKTVYERTKQLYEQGVVAKADFENAQASYESSLANLNTFDKNILAAQFTVKSSEATVKEQKKNLSQTNIYAHIDGVVSKLYKKKGEQVVGTAQMAGTPILKIANLNSIEVRADVNERDILEIELGDSVEVEVTAYPKRKFKGKVTQIANIAANVSTVQLSSDQVTNFEVRVRLETGSYQDLQKDNTKSPFRAGMSAEVEVITNILPKVLVVPIGAVTAKIDTTVEQKVGETALLHNYVFIQSGDTVLMREVKIGAQDRQYYELLEGLKVGESVVSEPYDAVAKQLKTGSKIRAVKPSELYKK